MAYASDFIRFVDREFIIDSEDEARRVSQIWGAYFEDTSRRLRHVLLAAAERGPLSSNDVKRYFLDLVRGDVATLQKAPTLPQYRSAKLATIYNKFKSEFESNRKHHFRGRPFTPAIINYLQKYAALILIKGDFRFSYSGLVIAGFGDDEVFPSLYRAACAGRVLGHMKLFVQRPTVITSRDDESVSVTAFAQGEMVYRFMEGIDENYSLYLRSGIEQLTNRITSELITKYSSGTATRKAQRLAAVKRTIRKMVDQFELNAMTFRQYVFVRPVLDIVSILPKEELAELAGALVNITSLKRKISMDMETVGGPIDVAVISKGDGFIWIKRKHYFRPELNPLFLQKYLAGQKN